MQRSVSDIFDRWLGPERAAQVATPPPGTCSCPGRRLGTGADPSVARALDNLGREVPHDYEAWERNVRDQHRIAEGDLAIAAARAIGYSGELVRDREAIRVVLEDANAQRAGEIAIRYQTPDLDPKGVGEPRSWVLSADVPEDAAARFARLAPAWVIVKHGSRVLRAAQRRGPPRQWLRRLPYLQTPPHREGIGT